jgi:RNA 3'-terminal phosphate cyclase (ATP)
MDRTNLKKNRYPDRLLCRSVGLLFQVALPPLLFAKPTGSKTRLFLLGGTNADFAPQVDYTMKVFEPLAARFGVKFKLDVNRRGYYPKGGGEVMVDVESVGKLTGVELTDFGKVASVKGFSFVAGALPMKVCVPFRFQFQAILTEEKNL